METIGRAPCRIEAVGCLSNLHQQSYDAGTQQHGLQLHRAEAFAIAFHRLPCGRLYKVKGPNAEDLYGRFHPRLHDHLCLS